MRLVPLLVAVLPLFAQEEPLRVLFLGNSYTHTNSMPDMVMTIANSTPGRPIEAKSVTRGGATLADLWTLTNGLDVLRNGTWDYVVLQDFSTLGQNFIDAKWGVNEPTGLLQWSRFWNAEIQRKNAKPLLYLTWARKAQPEFQTGLNYAYAEASREIGADIAPVGLAWKRIRETQPQMELFTSDGSHPSPLGTYLTACVFVEVLTKKSCAGASKIPTIVRITPEEQTQIADAAHYAIEQYTAGILTTLAKPDYGTLRMLPTPMDTKPGDFSGHWKGKARIYTGIQDIDLKVTTDGRTCKGSVTLHNENAGLTFTYPLGNCTIDHVTMIFFISDPRLMVEEFRAVIDGDRMVGTHVLRDTNPYRRMQGSFELKKD